MKKLISVFAAMALVGSVAAAPKKPAPAPAKAPAAPAVAAPVAAVAAVAPTAKGDAGIGLFVEGFGAYTFANGSSTSVAADGSSTDTAATAKTYKSSGSTAIGGGANIGYQIANNLAAMVGFHYRSFSTREYNNIATTNSDNHSICQVGVVGCAKAKTKQTWNNMGITIGLRPSVNALGGQFYGGAGLLIILPYETVQTSDFSEADATFNAGTGSRTRTETTKGYNLALGAYGELGYNFFITQNLYVGLGLKAFVATTDNKNKTQVVKNTDNTPDTTTTTYSDSLTSTDYANVTSGSDTTNKRPFETLGITDFAGAVTVGIRF